MAKYAPYIKDFFQSHEGMRISDQWWELALLPEDVLEAYRAKKIDLNTAIRRLQGTDQIDELLEEARPEIVQRFINGAGDLFQELVRRKGWDDPLVGELLAAIERYEGHYGLPIGAFAGAPPEILERLAAALVPVAFRRITEARSWGRRSGTHLGICFLCSQNHR